MQIQLQLYPNHTLTLTLTPPISSPPSRTFSDSKFVSNSRFNSGFSTSLKTVLKSRIRFRDFGPLSTDGYALFVQGKDVDNGLQVNNSSFNSMFFDSLKRVSKSKRSSDGLIGVKCAVSLKGNGGQVGLQRNGDDENDDRYYMRRCVELARKAIGCTSPNPMVGCVIVKEGKIVGEGFHPKAGQPHAEVFALRDAGDLAENATAYVSLEPCNHYGRTPPCTEALIKAKVKKVVVGMVDPNPIVASKGVDRLRDAGIEVIVGVEEESCKKLNEAYIHQMLTGKPFFTLRYSLSVNGQFLNQLGEGVYEQGGYYSKLFQEYDAVILSQSSIFEKHGGYFRVPALGEPGANHTARFFIADSKVSLWTNLESETGQEGVSMQNLGQISLNTILEQCKGRGLCSVLLDLRGNPTDFEELLEECLKENLLQKLVIEVLPLWEGSTEARFPAALEKNFGQRVSLKNLTSRLSEESVVLEGYFL